jgi:hypothetical protein
MTGEDEADTKELLAKLKTQLSTVTASLEEKEQQERQSLMDSVRAHGKALGKEFSDDELKAMDLSGLQTLNDTLGGLIERINASDPTPPSPPDPGSAAGLLDRSKEEMPEAEVRNSLVDMVSHAFNLPIPEDEKVKNQINEQVRLELMAEGYDF